MSRCSTLFFLLVVGLAALAITARETVAFSPLLSLQRGVCGSRTRMKWTLPASTPSSSITALWATTGAGDKNKGGKRKRRRRKRPAGVPAQDPVRVAADVEEEEEEIRSALDVTVDDDVAFEFQTDKELTMGVKAEMKESTVKKSVQETSPLGTAQEKKEISEDDLSILRDVAQFEFNADDAIPMGVQDEPKKSAPSPTAASDGAIPLPDIKEVRKRKQLEEAMARMEEEKEEKKVKIKRSDKEAFVKLLEQQPYADADDSLFEEEEYGTVSALLGEGAKPFLSIPAGPLQVGHFIGALGIALMAFIEYPGFPLTNLPTPLRDCLQGGLLTVYTINIVLAVFAAFKASERGQPIPLWVAKTVSVGGLAYDQLTQLPTLEETEKARSVKGKRAIKNKKR